MEQLLCPLIVLTESPLRQREIRKKQENNKEEEQEEENNRELKGNEWKHLLIVFVNKFARLTLHLNGKYREHWNGEDVTKFLKLYVEEAGEEKTDVLHLENNRKKEEEQPQLTKKELAHSDVKKVNTTQDVHERAKENREDTLLQTFLSYSLHTHNTQRLHEPAKLHELLLTSNVYNMLQEPKEVIVFAIKQQAYFHGVLCLVPEMEQMHERENQKQIALMLFSNIQLTHLPSSHQTVLPHRLSLLEPAELEKQAEQEVEHQLKQQTKNEMHTDFDNTSNKLHAAQTAPSSPVWGVQQDHMQEATSTNDKHLHLHEEEEEEKPQQDHNFYEAATPSSASFPFAKYVSTPLGRKRQEPLFHVDGSTSRRMSSSHFVTTHYNSKNSRPFPNSHKSNYLLPYPYPHPHPLHQQQQQHINNTRVNNNNNISVKTVTNTTPQTTNTTTTTTSSSNNKTNKIIRTNSHTSPITSSQPWPSANISSERGHVVDSVELSKLIKRLESLNGIDKVIASEHLPQEFLMNVLSFIMFVQEILRRLRMLKCCSLICFLSVTRQTFIVADVVPLEWVVELFEQEQNSKEHSSPTHDHKSSVAEQLTWFAAKLERQHKEDEMHVATTGENDLHELYQPFESNEHNALSIEHHHQASFHYETGADENNKDKEEILEWSKARHEHWANNNSLPVITISPPTPTAHREHETSQPYSDNIITSYSYRHAPPLQQQQQLSKRKQGQQEQEHNKEAKAVGREEENNNVKKEEQPTKSKDENSETKKHQCNALEAKEKILACDTTNSVETNEQTDKSDCFVDYLSPTQTTKSSLSVLSELNDERRSESNLRRNTERTEKAQFTENMLSSSKAKWVQKHSTKSNLFDTNSDALEVKDEYNNEVSNVSSLTNTPDPLTHLPVLMSVDKSTETSIREPHEITIPTAGATSHRVGPDYVPLEEMLSVEMIEHLTACDGSLYVPRQLDRNHVCSATLIFPFITAERLALLDQINDVQLSSWKGLLYFGIPFTNALTEEVAITEQQPSPTIITLNYDSAEGKLENMMNEKSVQVMPESSISSVELSHKPVITRTEADATAHVSNKQDSQKFQKPASKHSLESKKGKPIVDEKKLKDSTAKLIIKNVDVQKDLHDNTNKQKDSDVFEDSSMILASGASLPVILVNESDETGHSGSQEYRHTLLHKARMEVVKSAPTSLINISSHQHTKLQRGKYAANKNKEKERYELKEMRQELNRPVTLKDKRTNVNQDDSSEKTLMSNKTVVLSLLSSSASLTPTSQPNINNNNNSENNTKQGFAENEYSIDAEVSGEEQLIDKIEHMEGVNEVPVIHAGSKVAALFGGYELPESVTAALCMYSTALETSLMLEEKKEKQEKEEEKQQEEHKITLAPNTELEQTKANKEQEKLSDNKKEKGKDLIITSTVPQTASEKEIKQSNAELVQSDEISRKRDDLKISTTTATATAVPNTVSDQINHENNNTTTSTVKGNKETNTNQHDKQEISKELSLESQQHLLSAKGEEDKDGHYDKKVIDTHVQSAEKKSAMKYVCDAEERGEAVDAYGEVTQAALTMRQKLHVLIYTTEVREDIEESLAQMGHCVTWITTLTRMHRYLVVGLAPFDVLVVDWQRSLIDETVQRLLLHKATKETVVIYHCKVHEMKTNEVAKGTTTPTMVSTSSRTHSESKSLLSSQSTSSTSPSTSSSESPSTSFPIPLGIIGTENVIFNSDLSKTVYESCLLEQTRIFVQQKHLLGSISSVHTRQSYQIVRQVGAGAFGDVFEVHMYASRGRLAMKRVFLKSATLRMLEILNREVTLMSELEHPNIVTFSHVTLDENALSIFMELCDGTLSERIDNPALTVQWNSVKRTENMSFFHPITHTMPLETQSKQKHQHGEQENLNLASHLSISSLSEHSVHTSKQMENLEPEHSHSKDNSASSRQCSRTQPSVIKVGMITKTSNTAHHSNSDETDDENDNEKKNVEGSSVIKPNYAITAREAVLIIHDIASGLAYLHHRDIIHRDIKPENILFLDGVAKIGDFGSAVKVHEKFPLTNMRGTLSYMSPEVLLGEPYGKPCDLWSFGCLIADVMGLNFGHLNGLHVPALIELYKSIPLEESLPITLTNRSTSNFENHYSPGTTKEVLEAVKSASYNAAKERSELKSMAFLSRSPTTTTLTTHTNAHNKKQQESSHLDNLSSAQLHSLEHFRINSNSKQMQLISVHSTPLPPLELSKNDNNDNNNNGNVAHEHTSTETHEPPTVQVNSALEKETMKNELSLKAEMSIPSPTEKKVLTRDTELQETNVVNTELSPKEQLPNVISTSLQVNFALSSPSSDNAHDEHYSKLSRVRKNNKDNDNNNDDDGNELHNKYNEMEQKQGNFKERKSAAVVNDGNEETDEDDKNNNIEDDEDDNTAVANGLRTVTCIQTNSISVISTQMARLPSSLVELFEKLFHRNPAKRMNIDELLDHPVTWDEEWMNSMLCAITDVHNKIYNTDKVSITSDNSHFITTTNNSNQEDISLTFGNYEESALNIKK